MLRIGMYCGPGTHTAELEACLRKFAFQVQSIGSQEVDDLSATGIQVLYLPGGWYHFAPEINERLRSWVRSGGGCVGTCAGSFLVAGEAGLIPGRVSRANIRGRVYLEPRQQNHPLLHGVVRECTRHQDRPFGEPIAVTHLGGPFIFPKDKNAIVASYDFFGEVGAIAAANCGRGRAVAIASHPELPLADLPAADMITHPERHTAELLPQGDTRLLIRNAVLWAAGKDVSL